MSSKTLEQTTQNIAVLVISCDPYEDCWEPFFTLFRKYWSTCTFPCYLGTNNKTFTKQGVTVINVGDDRAWADNVNKMLDCIEERYVITFLEDFFLCKKVDEKRIEEAVRDFFTLNLSMLRLLHNPKGTLKISDSVLKIKPEDEYCVSTQISLWDKEVLRQYLVSGYSAWEFEILNSRKITKDNKINGTFATVKAPIFKWKNGVIQRRWVRSTPRFLKKNNILLDSERPLMTRKQAFKEKLRGRIRRLLPKAVRTKLKNLLLKTRFSDEFVDKMPK